MFLECENYCGCYHKDNFNHRKLHQTSGQPLGSFVTARTKQVISEDPHSGCPLKHRAHKESPVAAAAELFIFKSILTCC